jgi:hypothetical protein
MEGPESGLLAVGWGKVSDVGAVKRLRDMIR